MRKILLTVLAGTLLLIGACAPIKGPAPSGEHAECETGWQLVANRRPDLQLVPHLCDNFGNTGWFGQYRHSGNGTGGTAIGNEYYDYATTEQYYGMWAHEYGHVWDGNRLNDSQRSLYQQIIGPRAEPPKTNDPLKNDKVNPAESTPVFPQLAFTGFYNFERYAEDFAIIIYGKPGFVPPDQVNQICFWGLMPC